MNENRPVPLWLLTLLISLASVGGALMYDRIAVAVELSNHDQRLKSIEEDIRQGQASMNGTHERIMEELETIRTAQQKIQDQQEEVRRRLGIR